MMEGRKTGAKGAATRSVILQAAERLLIVEGYGSITSRRVAKEAGLTSANVHYYFPTIDALLLELYNQTQKKFRRNLDRALAAEQPLSALWKMLTNTRMTSLSVEMIALANHRKAIRSQMSADMRGGRRKQAEKLQQYLDTRPSIEGDLDAFSMLLGMIGFSRLIVVDAALGATEGHRKLKQTVEAYIRRIEGYPPATDADESSE